MIADDLYTTLVVAIGQYTDHVALNQSYLDAEEAQVILDDFLNFFEQQDYGI